MTSKERSSPFRPVLLSLTDTKELQALAKTILNANLVQYLHYSDVNPDIWRLIKVKDQIRVYSQKTENRKKRFRSDQLHVDDDSDLPSMLLVGSTAGTLDKKMQGVVGCMSSNNFSHAAVLSTIKKPSPIQPFESVAVKWVELDVRRSSIRLVKNRDYVYVEATGVETLPNGDHIGYHLMHSVDIPTAHELPGRVRAKLSLCSFYRQASENSLSVYTRAMINPMSDRVRRLFVPRFVKVLLSMFTCGEGGKVPKLVQILSKSYKKPENSILLSSHVNCTTCTKRMWSLTSLNSSCMLCREHVCSSCKIEKKLKTSKLDQKETTRKVFFCFSCLTDVMLVNDPEFSFVEDSNDGTGMIRPSTNSVWSLRTPSWGLTKRKDTDVDFANTR